MKGKRQKKRKIGKIMLLSMSFLLTIVLTFTITMAWFFDSDWASNHVTMAGSVGIEIRDYQKQTTSGSGNLNFEISTNLAYPGQSIQVCGRIHEKPPKSVRQEASRAAAATSEKPARQIPQHHFESCWKLWIKSENTAVSCSRFW